MPFQSISDGGSQLTLTAVEDMMVVLEMFGKAAGTGKNVLNVQIVCVYIALLVRTYHLR